MWLDAKKKKLISSIMSTCNSTRPLPAPENGAKSSYLGNRYLAIYIQMQRMSSFFRCLCKYILVEHRFSCEDICLWTEHKDSMVSFLKWNQSTLYCTDLALYSGTPSRYLHSNSAGPGMNDCINFLGKIMTTDGEHPTRNVWGRGHIQFTHVPPYWTCQSKGLHVS